MFPQHEMGYAGRLVRRVARRMVGQASFVEADFQDLQQDLWLDLLERLAKFQADRGHIRAFIKTVVNNKAASILETRNAAKRAGEIGMRSLNEEFEDEDGQTEELQERISVDDYLRRTHGTMRTECERQDLAIDLRKVIERKPAHIHVALILLVDQTAFSVASTVGLPRTTLRDMIKSLREDPDIAELRNYL